MRLQAVDTYFDPLDMFRQIAPHGVVNKQIIDHKVHSVDKAAALDDQAPVDHAAKDVQESAQPPQDTAKITDPVESAQNIVDSAASQGEDMKTEHTEPNNPSASCPVTGRSRTASSSSSAWEKVSNPSEEVHRSQYSSSVTGNVEEHMSQKDDHIDHSPTSDSQDVVDQHLEKSASEVHPHPKDMETAVQPNAGEAVIAEANSEETRLTHEEMSRITPSECPFLMNRE